MPEYTRKPFQIEDISKLRGFGDATANFSEMGCYKTSTALFLLEDLQPKKTLIVTSKTGKVTYMQTLPFILPDEPFHVVDNTWRDWHDFRNESGVFLAHYNSFTRKSEVAAAIRHEKWDAVILDESHRIKSHTAQCSKQLWYVKSPWRHIMTGSPFTLDPSDLWSQIKFLTHGNPKALPGFNAFREYFCELESVYVKGRESGFRRCVGIREDHKAELKDKIYQFAVRRTKAEVFQDLPEKVRYRIPVQLNATQRRMYEEIKRELLALDEAGTPFHAPNVVSALMRLRQITAATPQVNGKHWNEKYERWQYDISLVEPSTKLDATLDLLAESSNQVVVFYLNTDVGKLLNARLQRAGITHANMLEKHNASTRLSLVNAFQDGAYKVFHSTLQLGSESITLTAADTVVFVDRDWSPKNNSQGEDRVHRPGQRRPTNVVYIEADGTVDGYVKHVVSTKQGWFRELFESTPSRYAGTW